MPLDNHPASTAWDPQQEPEVWLPAELDLEPEQCWCLIHGRELPCSGCLATAIAREVQP